MLWCYPLLLGQMHILKVLVDGHHEGAELHNSIANGYSKSNKSLFPIPTKKRSTTTNVDAPNAMATRVQRACSMMIFVGTRQAWPFQIISGTSGKGIHDETPYIYQRLLMSALMPTFPYVCTMQTPVNAASYLQVTPIAKVLVELQDRRSESPRCGLCHGHSRP